VSRYQKGKTNLDFTEARDNEWQWQQLGHMQVCTLLQTDNHAYHPTTLFFTGRMPFLPPNQQRQSTEGNQSTPSYYTNKINESFLEQLQKVHVLVFSIFCLALTESLSEQAAVI